jgi:hypothetical protein
MIEELESLQEVHTDLPAKAFIKAAGEQKAGMIEGRERVKRKGSEGGGTY